MVNKINPADIAAFSSIKGMEGLTLDILLQIQGLIKSHTAKNGGVDHAELSKLVKNILEAPLKEGSKPPSLVHLLPALKALSPEMIKLIKQEAENTSTLVPKTNVQPTPSETAKSPTIQRSAITPNLNFRQPLQAEKGEFKQPQVPLSQPMQHAIKEVIQALNFLLPNLGKKDDERLGVEHRIVISESPIPTAKEATNTEFMGNAPNPKAHEEIKEKKAPLKSEFQPTLSPLNNKSRPIEKRASLESQELVSSKPEKKIEEPSTTPKQPQLFPVPKKQMDPEQMIEFESSQPKPNVQPQVAERTVIPGVPYPTHFMGSELRRKEKKKYPHYFSDREEWEEDPEKKDP